MINFLIWMNLNIMIIIKLKKNHYFFKIRILTKEVVYTKLKVQRTMRNDQSSKDFLYSSLTFYLQTFKASQQCSISLILLSYLKILE